MRIAVTNENNKVFQHFGQCESFAIFQIEDGEIKSKTILDAGENGHSSLATLLSGNNIDILICGGIGEGATEALKRCGIELVGGADGDIDHVIQAYMKDSLVHDPNFACNGHNEATGHSCSGHGHKSC